MPPFLELMRDHKSGSYIPYPLLTSTGKMQETRPTDFHSYPRRLASLNVISKEAHSPQLNLRCWVLFQSGASTFDLPHGSSAGTLQYWPGGGYNKFIALLYFDIMTNLSQSLLQLHDVRVSSIQCRI